MFFWKKKEIPKNEDSAFDKSVDLDIATLLERLRSLEGDERYNLLNRIGNYYQNNGEVDMAIKYYEYYIDERRTLGKVYGNILKLYNQKRREAAQSKNDIELQFYLNKIDDLMKLSKDLARGL